MAKIYLPRQYLICVRHDSLPYTTLHNFGFGLAPEDYRGLTLLIYAHVNPYGRFDLDLDSRIDFGKIAA